MTSILFNLRLWVAGLAVAGLGACGPSTPAGNAEDARAPIDAPVGEVAATEWPSMHEVGGVVRARHVAVLSSRVIAPVSDVRVSAGDRVRRGQTLVVLDGREPAAFAARATAAAAGSELGLEAATAEQRAAESALVLARATHERIRGLRDKNSATAQEMDEAAAALAGAEARLASTRARVAEAGQSIAAARAAENAASVGSSYTVLTAPFDGRVSMRHADPGSLAAPGSPLLTVEDTSAYHLEVRVDESRARLVAVGGEAEVRLDPQTGGVDPPWQVAPVIEVASLDSQHSFLVKLALPRSPDVRSGQFGRARLLGPVRSTLTVPAEAIVRRGQLTFVYAIDTEGAARLRMVSVGETRGGRVEVLAGLAAGERLVTAPPVGLDDGRLVRGAAAGAPR